MRRIRITSLFALALLLFFVLSGCGSTNSGHTDHAGHESTEGSHSHDSLPDNKVTTASPDILPAFLDNFSETTRNLYAAVPKYEHILKELNCYCGCMEYDIPHDGLFRCFIIGIDDDGVHWTDHGGACGICMLELRDAVKMAEDGKSLQEIQQHIDATYGPNA